jgi:glyoxylate/hydroxypyruvate/2-ketogluconate reductase
VGQTGMRTNPGAAGSRVVVTRRVFPELLEALAGEFAVFDNQDDVVLTPDELSARVTMAHALLADPATRIDEALLSRCPDLRVVSNIAVGFNNIDVPACTARGIVVTNTPDVLNQATADHAWALLLSAARRVVESDRWTRGGHWKRFALDSFLGADIHGATLGILGMGRIGSAVARRASGFDMRVIYHNRRPPQGADARLADDLQARWVERDELLRESDFLVLLVPYSAATHHLIGSSELALMKPTAVLVNVARGGVVDDAALVQALRAGRPGAAALDVMENEPRVHPDLLALENVVLTPHIASATGTSRRGMVRLAMQNLRDVMAGRRPAALVNPDVWESRRKP